jgi:hypothetical protein
MERKSSGEMSTIRRKVAFYVNQELLYDGGLSPSSVLTPAVDLSNVTQANFLTDNPILIAVKNAYNHKC